MCKAAKRSIWAQKVVHSEWGTGSKVNQESFEAVGILHCNVLRISKFGLREFPDATASPSPEFRLFENQFPVEQYPPQINTRCFCALDGKAAVASHMGTDGTASAVSAFYTPKCKCISQMLQVWTQVMLTERYPGSHSSISGECNCDRSCQPGPPRPWSKTGCSAIKYKLSESGFTRTHVSVLEPALHTVFP